DRRRERRFCGSAALRSNSATSFPEPIAPRSSTVVDVSLRTYDHDSGGSRPWNTGTWRITRCGSHWRAMSWGTSLRRCDSIAPRSRRAATRRRRRSTFVPALYLAEPSPQPSPWKGEGARSDGSSDGERERGLTALLPGDQHSLGGVTRPSF